MESKDSKHSICVNKSVVWFQVFRDINIAYRFRQFARDSYLLRIIYSSLPWILQFVNIYNMVNCNVLYSKSAPVFSFGRDVSNSIVLPALLFISYYLSGYYTDKANELFDRDEGLYIKREYISKVDEQASLVRKQIGLKAIAFIILAGISIGAVKLFYGTAKLNGEKAFWIYHLNFFGKAWYRFILAFTWYISLCFLATVIITSLSIYLMLADDALIIPKEHPNQSFHVMRVTGILINSFSYGIFYVGGAIIFIINDKLTYGQFGIINTFYRDMPSLIVFVAIVMFVILQFIPLQLMYEKLKENKYNKIKEIDKAIENCRNKGIQCYYNNEKDHDKIIRLFESRKELIEERTLYFSFSNKIIVTASILIPMIGVVLQLAQLLKMK